MKSLVYLSLLLLASCAPKVYWTGFHGPAYLPSPAPHPQPHPQGEGVPSDAARQAAYVRHLDSIAVRLWTTPPCQQRPFQPKAPK